MNGTTSRTKRTIVCRQAHEQLPHITYKTLVKIAKENNITGNNSDDVKNLVSLASQQ